VEKEEGTLDKHFSFLLTEFEARTIKLLACARNRRRKTRVLNLWKKLNRRLWQNIYYISNEYLAGSRTISNHAEMLQMDKSKTSQIVANSLAHVTDQNFKKTKGVTRLFAVKVKKKR